MIERLHNSSPSLRSLPSPVLASDRPRLPHRNSSFSALQASFTLSREPPFKPMPLRSNDPQSSKSQNNPQDDSAAQTATVEIYPTFDLSTTDPSASESVSNTSTSVAMSPYLGPTTGLRPPQSPVSFIPLSTTDDSSMSTSTSSAPSQLRSMFGIFTRPLSEPPRTIYSPRPVRASDYPTETISLPTHNSSSSTLQSDLDEDGHEGGSDSRRPSLSPHPSAQSLPGIRRRVPIVDRGASPPLFTQYYSSRSPFPSHPPDWLRDHTEFRRRVSSPSSIESSLPAPTPPLLLSPPPPPLSGPFIAPHESFLSPPGPAYHSAVVIETHPHEYCFVTKLPNFDSEAITISMRRARILNVAADSWKPDGGHFERRVRFGYDADLSMVRAEYDGLILRVRVPRRQAPMTYWGPRA